ncbi:hypothetical protein U1Q18_022514 [Sarracenia purpurea var. burkii]
MKCFLNPDVDQRVKAILKLIEEDRDSFEKKAEMYNGKRPEFITHVEGLHRMYRLLADRYDHLTGELRKHVPSLVQIQDSVVFHSGSGQDSPLKTPDQKLGLNKLGRQVVGFDLFLSSSGGSDLSLKEGSESSSLASDSESESFYSSINKPPSPHSTGDGKGLCQKFFAQETEVLGIEEKVKVQENENYRALLVRITEYEEQLNQSNKKLQLSEKEIASLKGELKKKEAFVVVIGELQAQLESAQRDNKMREAKLEMERKKVLELRKEVAELGIQVSDSNRKIGTLVEELEIAREKLKISEDEFNFDKEKLNFDISILLKQIALLEARVEGSELRSKSLETEISQCEAEKREMKCLHEAQQIGLQSEVERLKVDVAERSELLEALNKKLDTLKVKYDMLVAEKDGIDAKVQTLIAEMNSRDNHIKQLEEYLREMHIKSAGLIIGSESAKELADELRLRVEELEKEVDRQRIVISDRAEEKREAIRQLCFSLEHYRNGYQELWQAFIGHKRHAVSAS